MKKLKQLILDENAQRFACFAVLIIYITLILMTNIGGFKIYCTADMLSDINVARMMWQQKTLFPEGWVFGNQYYIIATPVLCSLMYGLTGNGVSAMILATLIMASLEIISFIWMLAPLTRDSRDAGFRSTAALAALSTVICVNAPFSRNGQLFYTMASYYACYIIVEFLALGHYIRLLRTERARRERLYALAGVSLLSFCSGMQSLRQTAVLILPLCGFELLRFCYEKIYKKREFDLLPTIHTGIITAANLVGCVLIKLLKIPNISIYDSSGNSGISLCFNAKGFADGLSALSELLGFNYFIHPKSARLLLVPILSLFCLGVTALAFCLMIKRRELRSGYFAVMSVLALSVAVVFAVSIFTSMDMRSIYFFTVFPLFAVAFVYCLKSTDEKKRSIAVLLFLGFALVSAVSSYYSPAKVITKGNISERNNAMVSWMSENDRDIVYGAWDVCEKISAADCESITAGYGNFRYSGNYFRIIPYLNRLDIYTEADNDRAVYVIEPEYREGILAQAEERGAEMTLRYVSGDGTFELYTSSKQLMNFE